MNKLVKRICITLAFIFVVFFALNLTACGDATPYEAIEYAGNFEIITQRTSSNCVTIEFYDKDTKVMYLFVKTGYGGGLTMLYNADGTPRLYDK